MLKKNLTYSDIPFFVSKNQFNNDLNLIKDSSAIKQALKNIVLSVKREKPFNRLFGGNPREFIFDFLDEIVTLKCKNLIGNAINNFEPRVILKEIVLQQSVSSPDTIIVIIIYKYRSTQVADTVTVSLERTR
jgi:phage baseplate assembly protein W